MPAGMMGISAFPAVYDKDIQTKVFRGMENVLAAAAWRQYFNQSFEKVLTLVTTGYSGFGVVPEWKDGEALPMDEAEKIYDMTLTALFYGMGFKVTRNMLFYDDAYNRRTVDQWVSALIDSVEHTLGVLHVATLNNAFTTTHTHMSSKTLCSTTHVTAGATTRSNRGAGAALTVANLETLRQKASKWVNYRGLATPINMAGAKLIHPAELENTTDVILNSVGKPGTTDNDTNFFRAKYVPVTEVRLTSTTAYFLQAQTHHLISNFSKPLSRVRYEEPNGNLVHGVEFHLLTGIEQPDGIFGDAGA